MDKEKIFDQLLKKSQLIHDGDIEDYDRTNFIDIPFEDFLAVKGDIFFHEERDSFYKNNGEIWYRFKVIKQIPKETKGLSKEEAKIIWDPELANRITRIEQWCGDLKKHIDLNFVSIDNHIKDMEKSQAEAVKELTDYVDLKIKEHELQCQKNTMKSKKSIQKKQP